MKTLKELAILKRELRDFSASTADVDAFRALQHEYYLAVNESEFSFYTVDQASFHPRLFID